MQVLLAALACCAAGGAAAQAPAAKQTGAPPQLPGEQPVKLDAASSEVDYKTNTVVFKDVIISQGAMRVQADHARATGLNFANSKWTFEGNVRINAEERGNLRSDSAVVEFKDNRILRATVIGKPAEFEQKRVGSEQMARGHADKIVYDVGEGSVRLADDAWLSDGQSEISGPLLVYDIRAQRVQAATQPDSGERVRITIQPNAPPEPGKDAAKKPTTAPDSPKPTPNPQS
jgi:lipopolysaccharide export system protein LptA